MASTLIPLFIPEQHKHYFNHHSAAICLLYVLLDTQLFPLQQCNKHDMQATIYRGEYALIQWTDFDYIWHGTYPPELSQKFQHPISITC